LLKILDPIEIGNINLHIIKTSKFKTNLVGVFLQRPLSKKEATMNSLLSMILNKATNTYPTFMEINRRLEELYGTILVSDVVKKGERHILQIKLQMPNEKYINNSSVFEKGLKLLNEVLNEPYIEKDGFNEKYFNQEKENLKEKIKGRINDKMKYALDRCIEVMCEDEAFSTFEYGDLKELDNINNEVLYDYYKKIIVNSPIDILLVGDIEPERAKELISSNIKMDVLKPQEIPREPISKTIDKIKYSEDRLNLNQGKLTLGYRTNIPYESELYDGSVIFSNILGGGPNSKLFKNIREKESLCYYIFSKIEKFKSIMLISSGIEFKNFEKTRDLILKEVKTLQNGDFTKDDIIIAKKSIINSIKSITDSPNMLMDFYYAQILSKSRKNLEEIMEGINKTNKESIIEAGKKFVLDTVYFLNKEEEGI